jgi:hypothetical protein
MKDMPNQADGVDRQVCQDVVVACHVVDHIVQGKLALSKVEPGCWVLQPEARQLDLLTNSRSAGLLLWWCRLRVFILHDGNSGSLMSRLVNS